jgi:hypothetical protein
MNSVTINEPGRRWRILARREGEKIELENQGAFDELVVDDWLHVEQMDDNVWWLRVGDVRLFVTVSETEPPTVDVERGFYASIKGVTQTSKLD